MGRPDVPRLLLAHLGLDVHAAGTLSIQAYRDTVVTVHRPGDRTWQWRVHREDAPEVVASMYLMRGAVAASAGDRDSLPDAAHAFMLHSSATASMTWTDDAVVAVAWLPAEAITSQGVSEDDLPFALESTSLTAASKAFVISAARQATRLPVTTYLMERLLVEMAFGLTLESGQVELDSRPPASARERARTMILLNRADPEFGPDELALELGISVRQLQRLFAQENSTPTAQLRHHRVQLAAALAADSSYAALTIAEIAQQSGFRTTATMRRAFAAEGVPWPRRTAGRRAAAHS